MNGLLQLQALDKKIGACLAREKEIPMQKNKFNIYRDRLKAELDGCQKAVTDLTLEQRKAEGDIEQKQEQINKYKGQLPAVKKNDEYQALLHEIEQQKKQIGQHEERIIAIMVELDEATARLEEDKKRIAEEQKGLDDQCAEIDQELKEAVVDREELEKQREPLASTVDSDLLKRYYRIRKSKPDGVAIVPLNGEVCGGCHMNERAQIVNEVIAGEKFHSCQHCGRLLYYAPNFDEAPETQEASS